MKSRQSFAFPPLLGAIVFVLAGFSARVRVLEDASDLHRGRENRRLAEPEWSGGIAAGNGSSASWPAWKASHPAVHVRREAAEVGSLDGVWREIGPSNVAGRVMAVAFRDPANPMSILAGAAGGGVFASEDLGQTWRQLGGDQLPSLWIGVIAVDPKDRNTFYAGTGDVNVVRGGSNGAGGILKTTDGGDSFSLLPLPRAGGFFRIVISFSNSDLVVAAATDGIYRSGDAGNTWTKTGPGLLPTDLLQDTVNPSRFLAVSSDILGGHGALDELLDEGRTWHPIGTGLLPADEWGRTALTLTDKPRRTLVLWSGDQDESVGGHPARLFRSLDDGATWQAMAEPSRTGPYGNNSSYGANIRVFGSAQGQMFVHHDGYEMYTAMQSGGEISESNLWTIAGGEWHQDTPFKSIGAIREGRSKRRFRQIWATSDR